VGPNTSAGPDAVREALVPWLQKVDHAVRTQHTLIQNMSVEIFAQNLGVQPEDEEWGVRWEALNDWELWGRLGTSYEHLLRIRKEDLYRIEVLWGMRHCT
jgi:hypothetical protein